MRQGGSDALSASQAPLAPPPKGARRQRSAAETESARLGLLSNRGFQWLIQLLIMPAKCDAQVDAAAAL